MLCYLTSCHRKYKGLIYHTASLLITVMHASSAFSFNMPNVLYIHNIPIMALIYVSVFQMISTSHVKFPKTFQNVMPLCNLNNNNLHIEPGVDRLTIKEQHKSSKLNSWFLTQKIRMHYNNALRTNEANPGDFRAVFTTSEHATCYAVCCEDQYGDHSR